MRYSGTDSPILSENQNKSANYQPITQKSYDEFYMKLSKPIIDEIDKLLAKHYGFTEYLSPTKCV